MLLLQEFDLKIKDKKGAKNAIANHLSRLVSKKYEASSLPNEESFLDEQPL